MRDTLHLWWLHLWTPIRDWSKSPRSGVHMCWFFAVFYVVLAVAAREVAWLVASPVWLVAGSYASRLAISRKQIEFQFTMLDVLFDAVHRENLIKKVDTGGESGDVDLGSSASSPRTMPSP